MVLQVYNQKYLLFINWVQGQCWLMLNPEVLQSCRSLRGQCVTTEGFTISRYCPGTVLAGRAYYIKNFLSELQPKTIHHEHNVFSQNCHTIRTKELIYMRVCGFSNFNTVPRQFYCQFYSNSIQIYHCKYYISLYFFHSIKFQLKICAKIVLSAPRCNILMAIRTLFLKSCCCIEIRV